MGIRRLFDELKAVARKPGVQRVLGIAAGIRKEQREVVGDGFVNPLVAITGPANHITPPLMRDLMIRKQLGKVFLAGRCQSGALLRFRREKGERRNVKEAGPTLTKGSGNLRDAEIAKGEWPGIGFVEANRGINLFPEPLQRIGGTRRWRRKCKREPRGRRPGRGGRNGDPFRRRSRKPFH